MKEHARKLINMYDIQPRSSDLPENYSEYSRIRKQKFQKKYVNNRVDSYLAGAMFLRAEDLDENVSRTFMYRSRHSFCD